MKTQYLFISLFFLIISQIVVSQNDTIRGLLLDVNNKVIKNYPVTLGKVNPVKVKTDKNGIFTFPNANLMDTLFVADKKGQNAVAIPVNGNHFLTIQSLKGDFNTKYLSTPDEQFLRQMQQAEYDKKKNLNTLSREDIVNSGCRDVLCLLKRLSGVAVFGEKVTVRGSISSLQGSSDPLIVLDGIVVGSEFSLSTIAVDEIESITVLKDASMYGVRGANGAILINTHRQ